MKEEGAQEWRAGDSKHHETNKHPSVQETNQQWQR